MMRQANPASAFWTLVGAGAVLAALLATAVFRTVQAGCPDGRDGLDLACLFVPTHSDLGIHLLSYLFVGTLVAGAALSVALWRRQRSGLSSLYRSLAVLRTSDGCIEGLAARLGLGNRVRVLDTGALLCFCAGLRSPMVYVSTGLADRLDCDELEALLLHEKHHLNNRDPLRMLLGKIIVSSLGFFPILRDFLERYVIEEEIAADASAIRHQGHCRGIAGALKKLARQTPAPPPKCLAIGAHEALSYRIDHLAGSSPLPRYRFPVSHVASSLLVAAVALAVALAPLSGSHP